LNESLEGIWTEAFVA